MFNKYKATPHWGLWYDVQPSIWNNINTDDLQQFVANYRFFNHDQWFCNDFTKQSGLDKLAFSQ